MAIAPAFANGIVACPNPHPKSRTTIPFPYLLTMSSALAPYIP